MSSEIRLDPLSGQRTLIAPARSQRPGALADVKPPAPIDPATDPFAPGNEGQTPPALATVPGERPGTWAARAFPNLYPSVSLDAAEPPPRARPDLLTALPGRGAHEIVVNAPDCVSSLGDLAAGQVATAMELWRERMRAHDGAAYVHVFVNEQTQGGASLPHTHAQLVALDFVPVAVARERERAAAYAATNQGAALLADVVQEEVKLRERLVAHDDECVLLSPFAAAMPYQLLIAPRVPRARFEDDGPLGAAMLHDALARLRARFGAMPPLTLWVRTAPRDTERFCWRIDVVPRLAGIAGLELGTGLRSNPVAPEQAAAELRG